MGQALGLRRPLRPPVAPHYRNAILIGAPFRSRFATFRRLDRFAGNWEAAAGCRAGLTARATYFPQAGTASLVGRTPWSARDALVPLLSPSTKSPLPARSRPGGRLRTRGGPGVRPTSYAGVSRTQKYTALGWEPAPRTRMGHPIFLTAWNPRRRHQDLGVSTRRFPVPWQRPSAGVPGVFNTLRSPGLR